MESCARVSGVDITKRIKWPRTKPCANQSSINSGFHSTASLAKENQIALSTVCLVLVRGEVAFVEACLAEATLEAARVEPLAKDLDTLALNGLVAFRADDLALDAQFVQSGVERTYQ